MARKKTKLKERSIEWLGVVLEDRIQEALAAALKQRSTMGSARPNKHVDYKRYRQYEDLSNNIKQYRRALGGIILTNPEHYKRTGLFTRILDKTTGIDNWGPELAQALKSWDGYMHYTTGAYVKGKVGHHRTALSVMRDALIHSSKDVRKDVKALALMDGYKLGEEFVDYLDPSAHMRIVGKIQGKIAEKLKGQKPSEELIQALFERSAHAVHFGDTTGLSVPAALSKPGASADEIYKASRPYLELAKQGADAGVELSDVVTKGNWRNQKELLKQIKEISVKDTTALQNRMRKDLMDAGVFDPKGTLMREHQAMASDMGRSLVKTPAKAGMTVEQVLSNVHQFPDEVIRNANVPKEVALYSGLPLPERNVIRAGGKLGLIDQGAIDMGKALQMMSKEQAALVVGRNTPEMIKAARLAAATPWMAGASIPLAHMALAEREKEVAANPDDPWLKANLWLDRLSLGADYTSVASYGAAVTGYGAAAPVGAELTSNIAAGLSGALDFGRWIKDEKARQQTAEWWTSVYQRGSRGLLKGAAALF